MARLNCAVSFADTRGNSRNTFSNMGVVRRSCLHLFHVCKEKRERERERKKKICNNASTVIHIYIYSNKNKLRWREFTREESGNARRPRSHFPSRFALGGQNSRRITVERVSSRGRGIAFRVPRKPRWIHFVRHALPFHSPWKKIGVPIAVNETVESSPPPPVANIAHNNTQRVFE